VQHCKHLLFHEATFLGLLCKNPLCLAPGTPTLTLGFLFVRREAGRDDATYSTDERAHALGKGGRELRNGRVWGLRTWTPCGIGVIIVRAVLRVYFTGVGIDLKTRTEWRRRPRTRVVITEHGLWLIQVGGIVRTTTLGGNSVSTYNVDGRWGRW